MKKTASADALSTIADADDPVNYYHGPIDERVQFVAEGRRPRVDLDQVGVEPLVQEDVVAKELVAVVRGLDVLVEL